MSNSQKLLDLIQSDLCGPLSPVTPGGNRYILTFIDDYSKYCTVYLIASKIDCFDCFRHYQSRVERLHERTIKVLRSDNGGEYTSPSFRKYLDDLGIIHRVISPYTSQQNGESERKNRSLLKTARSLIYDSQLPALIWGEAVMIANYIQNLLPSANCATQTPYEIWHNKNLIITYSKCSVVSHLPISQRHYATN
jgi:transposase InsO family protein